MVAVATYRRPELLRECLDSLSEQSVPVDQFTICVVDNDPEPSARQSVQSFTRDFRGKVSYVHEPKPGIPAARNAAIAFAIEAQARWIAFIDDDERADPGWLAALLAAATEYNADGVQGPVFPRFEAGGQPEVPLLGFHDRPVAERGTRVHQAKTGNLLLRIRAVVELVGDQPFREDLGDFGGSDSEMTMRLTGAGGVIVTEPSAMVEEFTSLERQSLSWMTRRATRTTAGFVTFLRQNTSALEFWLRRPPALARWASRTVRHAIRYRLNGSELDRLQMHLCAARFHGHLRGLRGRLVAEYARTGEPTAATD